eukprot:scaffold336_cov250-Pinguiococcus_pyrenoidosus.AAC.32
MMRLLRLVLLLIASSSPVAPLWSGTAVAARRGAALHSRAGQGGDFSQRGRSSDGLSRAFRAGVVISAEEEQRLAKEVRLAQDVQSKIGKFHRSCTGLSRQLWLNMRRLRLRWVAEGTGPRADSSRSV